MTCQDFSILAMFVFLIAVMVFSFLDSTNRMCIIIAIIVGIVISLLWFFFFSVAYLLGYPLK